MKSCCIFYSLFPNILFKMRYRICILVKHSRYFCCSHLQYNKCTAKCMQNSEATSIFHFFISRFIFIIKVIHSYSLVQCTQWDIQLNLARWTRSLCVLVIWVSKHTLTVLWNPVLNSMCFTSKMCGNLPLRLFSKVYRSYTMRHSAKMSHVYH